MNHAWRVLEFDLVREALFEHCLSTPGQALCEVLEPSFVEQEVTLRLAQTKEADEATIGGYPALNGLSDLAKQAKLASKGSTLSATDLARVGRNLRIFVDVAAFFNSQETEIRTLSDHVQQLLLMPDLSDRLSDSVTMDGEVLDSASSDLRAVRAKIKKISKQTQSAIESYVSGKSRDLLSDPIVTSRNGRPVIPLKAEHKGKIKGIVHDSSTSGQTVYLEPHDVVELGNQLRIAEGEEKAEVERILAILSAEFGAVSQEFVASTDASAELDLIFAKVRHGRANRGTIPERAEESVISIQEGRHPLLKSESVVPLSLSLGGEHGSILITGPNTGGKTVALKTIGLFVLMAQCGMMVPAIAAEIGFFPDVFADIGDEQSLQQSLSTFSGHIKNIAFALKAARSGALVLLDEVGAGTDPAEGAALAQAILQELIEKGCVVMASTHYGELKIYAANQRGLTNASMEFDLKSLAPTYRFVLGTPGSSHAIKIASRHGVPDSVIKRAEAGFSAQDQDVAVMINKLTAAQKQAQKAQSEADRLSAKLRETESALSAERARAQAANATARAKAQEELEELLREIRVEAAQIFDEVKRSGGNVEFARRNLKELQEVGKSFATDLKPQEAKPEPPRPDELQVGSQVKIRPLGLTGTVTREPRDGRVEVLAGLLRSEVKVTDVELVKGPAKTPQRQVRRSSSIKVDRAQRFSPEIHLRMMRAESALEKLEQFLDDALLAGSPSIRIVHGKGEGILREITRDYLRKHRNVKSFGDATAEEGGQGVTVAILQ